jgi:hypothetical protein
MADASVMADALAKADADAINKGPWTAAEDVELSRLQVRAPLLPLAPKALSTTHTTGYLGRGFFCPPRGEVSFGIGILLSSRFGPPPSSESRTNLPSRARANTR